MTARRAANLPASVLARLLNVSRAEGIDFQLLLNRFIIEQFLYRLGRSPERDRFALKGAMLFAVWVPRTYRPTRDLDLLGTGPAFLSQIITFTDADLERLYVYARLLWRRLPRTEGELPLEVQDAIDMASYRVEQRSRGQVKLERGSSPIEPITGGAVFGARPEEFEPLSRIIAELNERFGTDFKDEDKAVIRQLEQRLATHQSLADSIRVNTPENARLTFDHVVNGELQDLADTNFKFYKKVTDDEAFARHFLDWLFDRVRRDLASASGR